MTKAQRVAAVDAFKVRYAKKRAEEQAAKADEKPEQLTEQVIATKEKYDDRYSDPSAPIFSTQFLYRVEAVSVTKLSQATNNSAEL